MDLTRPDPPMRELLDEDERALLLRIYALGGKIRATDFTTEPGSFATSADARAIQKAAMALAERLGIDLASSATPAVEPRNPLDDLS